jgi:hypothetical protein
VLKMDPGVKTSREDLQRQFRLASRLAAGAGEFSAAVTRADDLQKQIAARKKQAAASTEAMTALSDLEKEIGAVAGSASGGGFGGFGFSVPGKEPATLRQVSAAMGTLLGIVDGADVAPSADATAAAEKWEAAGKSALGRWEAIQTKDVASVNSLMEKVHFEPLRVQ